ncbi:MAG TPA: aromatic acid exporter family protein [Symbiobacteriaceae bacterium]
MDRPTHILRPFLGARILKTGLAVFLALAAFHWFGSEYATFAAVAAILAVQPSVSRARTVFNQQMIGNLIGGAVAAAIGLWLGSDPLGMALGVMITLGICSRLRLTEAANLAVIAVLYIMDRPEQDFLLYTGARMAVISAGMLIGYLVNRFVKPPDFTAQIRAEITAAREGVAAFCDRLLASLTAPESLSQEQVKADTEAIRHHLDNASRYLELYHETRPEDMRHLPLERTRSALSVAVERLSDIHQILLQAGGLRPGPEVAAVAGALRAMRQYMETVTRAALHGAAPDDQAGAGSQHAEAALADLVSAMVHRPEERQRGLVLHSILTNVRHMHWRIDGVASLLRSSRGAGG